MFSKTHIVRHILAFGLVFAMSAVAFADTLRLKDGSIIKGRIVAFSGGKFTVAIGEGSRGREMTFDAADIESIQFDAPSRSAASDRAEVQKDPEFIEASLPPKSVPRVITRDTLPNSRSQTKPPSVQTVPETPVETPASQPASLSKPLELNVKVFADNTANGWTNSGWVVKKGQKIRIIGEGSVSLGKGKTTGPSGSYDIADDTKLLKSVPTGALIAVIGDDNNEFIYIGSERTFTASRDGALFLGVNEGNLNDNSGTFSVKIEVYPS